MQSTLYKILIVLGLLFPFVKSFASHYAGGEIMFECYPANGPNAYRLVLSLYFDCTGVPHPSSETICILNGSSVGSSVTLTANQIPSTIFVPNPNEVTPVCLTAVNTPCMPGADTYPNGFRRVLYEAFTNTTHITRTSTVGASGIPGALSPPVIFSMSNCCRNPLINASGSNFYIETKMFRVANPCNNNSPAFNDNPILRFCLGVNRCYAFNAFDPDGDSLVYNLATALDASCGTTSPGALTYFSGYSATSPFGASAGFSFNPVTGEFCAAPTTAGKYVFSMEVSDYRYYTSASGSKVSVKMSTVQRDVQVFVDACGAASPPQPTFTLFNAGLNDTTIVACQTFSTTITITPPAAMGGNMNVKVFGACFGAPINATCGIIPANCFTVTTPYTPGVGVNSAGLSPVNFGFTFTPVAGQIGAIYNFRVDARYCIGPDEILVQKVYRVKVIQEPRPQTEMRCTSVDAGIPSSSITVTGNNMIGGDSVFVYRATSPAGPFGPSAIIHRGKLGAMATSYSYTDNTVTPSSNIYWYKMGVKPPCGIEIVMGRDTINNIKLSGSITVANIVTLNWNKFTDITNGTDSYKIMRDVGSGFVQIATTTDTTYTDNVNAFPCSVVNVKYRIDSDDEAPLCTTNSNTIQLTRTIPPLAAVSVISPSPCNATSIQIVFSSPVSCASATASAFTVTGPGGPYTVTGVTGSTPCVGGLQDTLEVTFTPAITASGTFTLNYTGGITDPCGNPVPINSFNFTIPSYTTSAHVVQHVLCFGQSTGIVRDSIFGGQPPYTYVWTNSSSVVVSTTTTTSSTNTVTGLPAGTYTVTITDNKGCVATTTVTINQPATAVGITLNSTTNVSCKGGSNGAINVSGTGGTPTYSYVLQPGSVGSTTGSYTGLSANTYMVIVTDANGCKDTLKNIIITEPATAVSLTLTSTTPVSCKNGSDGQIVMSGSGGTGTLTYVLTPTSATNTTGTFTGLIAGTYSVTVTDANGCTATVSGINVTQPLPISVATLVRDSVNCNGGSDGSITVTGSGGNTGGYTYTLNPGSIVNTTGNFTGLAAGTYTINIKDTKNCDTTFNVTIHQPSPVTISETHINVLCKGDATGSITVTGGGGTVGAAGYQYSLNGGPFGSSNVFSGLTAGSYTIQVRDKYGCLSSILNVVITEPTNALSGIVASTLDPKCHNSTDGEINITASGGTSPYSYTLMPGSVTNTTGTFTGLGSGTYSVTITDNNNCTFTITNIILNNPTAVAVAASITQNVSCNGGNDGIIDVTSVTGGQGSPYTVSLTGPVTSSYSGTTGTFTGLTAGNYTVTVTDANNCSQTVNLTITQPDPLSLNTVVTDVTCNGLSNGQINAAATGGNGGYSYTLNPGAVTNGTGVFSGLSTGAYTVTVTDSKNCTATVNVTVNQPATLVATGGTASTKCNSTSDAFIQIGVTGGNTGGFTYTITPGGTTNSTGFFDNLGAGTYIVTVTDSKGCSDTALVVITSPPPVQPTTLVRATVTATDATNGQVLIEWNPSVSTNIKEYVVDWLNPVTSTWIPVDTVNALSTTHTLNTTTNPNIYRVSVVDICGNRTVPSPEHHTVFLTASVAGLDKQVQLNWTNYIGWSTVNSYKLYRRDVTNGGASVLLATLTGNSYLDTDVRCKVVYEYVVEANGDAISMSNTVRITPQDIVMPNSVEIKTATVENNKDIRIIWKANNSSDAYQYHLYRIMSGTISPKLIAKLPLTDTTYLDTDVKVQDRSYTYYIMVEDSCGGFSNNSNIGRSILLNGGIGQGISFTNTLNWNPYESWANGVKEYEVWRFTTLLPTPSMLGTTSSTAYEDDITGFTDENVFYYYVIAKEQDGNNAISVSNVRAIVQPPRYFVPSAFTPGGANPTFNITGVFIKSYVLRVFDRWGNQIFETNDRNKSWDGGDYPQGVYSYTLRLIGVDGKTYDKAGTITLLR